MADEILRLGIDTRDVEVGARKAGREYGEVAKGARQASEANEKLERVMRETGKQSARAAQAMQQSSRANRAVAESTARAAREQDVYARAARERLQTEREVSRMASGQTQVSAVAAAESYIRAQESYFQTNMARVQLAAAQGLISPAEASAQGRQAAEAYNRAIAGVIERRPAFRDSREAFTSLAGSMKDVHVAGNRGSLGMHRLNNSLIVLARQATNTHPVVGQLTDVVGTFAIGTAKMVPILAGIAALGAAWRLATRDAREAKEEHERLLEILDRTAERRRIEGLGPGGEAREALAAADAEIARIRGDMERASTVTIGTVSIEQEYGDLTPLRRRRVDALTEELRERNQQRRLLAEEIAEAEQEAERETTEAVKREEAERAQARREGVELKVRLLKVESDAEAARAQQRREDLAEENRLAQVQRDAEARRAQERRQEFELRRKVAAAVAENEREAERLREQAAQRQEQATQKLVQALQNVGRAYGGVTDQILALTAATLSLERMPMETGRARATAYGTAGATGVGIGASSGNPWVGAWGGAASGAAMAGPYGAVIGGVAGFVSGLLEQGERAQEAARQQAQALEDWRRAVDVFGGSSRAPGEDEFQARLAEWRELHDVTNIGFGPGLGATAREWVDFIERIERGGGQISAAAQAMWGDLVELGDQWEEFMARIREERIQDLDVRELVALGQDEEANRLRLQIEQQREMQRAIEQGWNRAERAQLEYVQGLEAERAEKEALADAINDVTRALNAPSGLNLTLHRWRALQMPSMDTSRPPRSRTGTTTGTGGSYDRPDRRGGDMYVENLSVNVDGAGDPTEVAHEVVRVVRREALKGGGSIFDVPNR